MSDEVAAQGDRMTLLDAGEGGARSGRSAALQRGPDATLQRDSEPARPAAPPKPTDPLQEGVKALRGILGF